MSRRYALSAKLALTGVLSIGFASSAYADIVNVSPTSLDFGDQVLTTSAVKTVTLANPTKKVLTILGISSTGDFSYQGGTCGSTLAPESECIINVQFAPTALGLRTGILAVSDDANDNTQKVKLSGNGTPVQLISIRVNPDGAMVPLGLKQQFIATGNFNNGTNQDVSPSCVWTSSVPSVATVNSSGLASSLAQGTTGIQAASGSLSGSAFLTVTAPVLISVAVSPAGASIAPGATQQFTATGTLSDGTTSDLTNSVTWGAFSSIATVSPSGLETGVSVGITPIGARAQASNVSVSGFATLEVGGFFTSTFARMIPRWLHTATLLNDGRVLLTGGRDTDSSCCGSPSLASSELFDPATSTVLASNSMADARAQHTATLLQNGKVLIAGGSSMAAALASAEIYDPGTRTFTSTGSMTIARSGHTATLLGNGQVLVVGGPSQTAELYDPSTGLFTMTGSMAAGRVNLTATLLNDGRVLVAGGGFSLASAEVYDPATGTFTAVGSMAAGRAMHRATLLNSGKVLITGGHSDTRQLSTAEVFDPSSGLFTATGSMISPRDLHTATLLNNGQILITGGEDSTGPLTTAEKYNPASGSFAATGNMQVGQTIGYRAGHTATQLINGQVFVTGGTEGGVVNFTSELYQPSTFAPPGLVSIAVSPGNAFVPRGTAQRFVAVGTFADGSTQILNLATWDAQDTSVATISNEAGSQGVAEALAVGGIMIKVTAGSFVAGSLVTGFAGLNVQ